MLPLSAQSLEFVSMTLSETDIDAQKYPRFYGDDEQKTCALVKVQLQQKGFVFENDFIIGDPEFKTNEYWVYMAEGAAKIDVKHPDCPKLSVNFGIKLEAKMTYVLTITAKGMKKEITPIVKPENNNNRGQLTPIGKTNTPTVKKQEEKPQTIVVKEERGTSFYIGPQLQPLGFMGIGGSAGVFIKRFNLEVDYVAGLTKSDEVFWNNTTVASSSSYSYEYTPSYFGAAIGCAIVNGKSFRLTPQVGVGSVSIKGKEASQGTNNPKATDGYAMTASVGARADIRFGSHFGLFLNPRFGFALSKSDLFQRVMDVSSDVKGYASGFSANVGFYLEF